MAGEGTTQVGKLHVFGFPATITLYDPTNTSLGSAFVQGNTQSLAIGHTVENRMIKSTQGTITGVHMSGEYVTCDFEFLAEGDTVADALKSSLIPEKGSTATVSGAQAIKFGPFADVLNTGVLSRWIYLGGGTVNLPVTDAGSSKITLHRFPGILATSAATVS